ncbi:arylesterase [Methylophaga sp. OBS3]|uniref:arylesterase n=1 Tax=Methylophaga sp. OBS3 TaxID=2991934 RepID=UPI0022517841|nr:arylesterase [Methylophaga sp. OBS3]MCX4188961.1 arylesterase [Methylophaga sp. OBS3]
MRTRLLLQKFISLLTLTYLLLAPAAYADDNKTMLVLGDSLSAAYGIDNDAGWVNLLRQKLQSEAGDWQVVNASISGETTDGGLRRLPALLDKHNPGIVVIALGGNDGLRGFQPSAIKQRLADMIQLAQADARVLLLGIEIPPNYGAAYTQAFRNIYSSLAEQYDTALLPFMLVDIYDDEGMMQADGIHPTAAAQPKILDNIWPALASLLD